MEKPPSFRDRVRQLASKAGGLLLNALCTMGEAERHMYAYMPPRYEGLGVTVEDEQNQNDKDLIAAAEKRLKRDVTARDFLQDD
jgi:hypothetical protein